MAQDSDERQVNESGETVVKAQPQARQAVEVRPMRFVLGVSLVLVIIGMAVSYMMI
jgi:cytochrome c biogenesis protein CcdA